MKTPMPDVDAFVEALRGDLPSAEDEARVRARLLAATLVATSALTSANAGASLGSAGASATGAGATSGAPAGVALIGGAGASGSSVAAGSVTAAAGSISAAASGAAGSLGAAAPIAAKTGLLAKLLVLPLSAKVGVVASVAVAVAATSVPLVLEQTRGEPHDASNASADVRRSPMAASHARTPIAEAAPDGVVSAPPGNEHGLQPAAVERGKLAEPRTQPLPGPARAGSSTEAEEPAPADARPERGDETRRRVFTPRRSGTNDARSSGPSASETRGATATRAARGRAPTAPARMSTLGEEARLMERAMLALGQGDAELARRFLAEHARRFPHGLLAPERERAAERANELVAGAHDGRTF